MQPGRARTSGLGVPPLLLARWVGRVAPVCPPHVVLVLSCPSAALRVHVCALPWATWLLFTGVSARSVVLRVRCPGPLGSCSPVCLLGVLCCVCGFPGPISSCSPVCPLGVLCCVSGVLGHLAPVRWCARLVCCVPCAVSWASCLLFDGVAARCFVLRARSPGPLGSCSPVCVRGVLCSVCRVLGHFAPVHRCAWSMRCFACAASCATWLPFNGVPVRCVVLSVRCPGPLGSCSLVCLLGALLCICGVLGHLAPVHRCAQCGLLCCVCSVLGHLAPVHRCARSVLCFASTVSWATWLLFNGVPAWCVVLRVWRPGPLDSCSPVCPLGVLCCVSGVLGHLAPVRWCARLVCCVACAVSWATGSCSTVWPLRVLCCARGVLGHLAPVHRCACAVCCVAWAVSWASWLLFTGAPGRCVALLVRRPVPLGSCSPVSPFGVLC